MIVITSVADLRGGGVSWQSLGDFFNALMIINL